jgi:hypothetical protein
MDAGKADLTVSKSSHPMVLGFRSTTLLVLGRDYEQSSS